MNAKQIYFLRPKGAKGPVKIGCSVMPQSRLTSIMIWSPVELELIAMAPGGHRVERSLHWMFRKSRRHGEWFRPTPKLAALIAHVQQHGEVPAIRIIDTLVFARNNSAAHVAKVRLSCRIGRAERHAHGYRHWSERPPWVTETMDKYLGADKPLPPAPEMAKLEAYIAKLLSRPKSTRTYREYLAEKHAA